MRKRCGEEGLRCGEDVTVGYSSSSSRGWIADVLRDENKRKPETAWEPMGT